MKTITVIAFILIFIVGIFSFVDVKEGKVVNFNLENIPRNYNTFIKEIPNIIPNIMGKISRPPPNYELRVTEVKYLKECIEIAIDKEEPCHLVNLEMFNNYSERVDFEITGKTIVTKDGKQIERYGGVFNTKQLNGQCDSSVYFKLFPNARTTTGMCFPLISKSDDPVMYIKLLANGKQKEHSFELAPYIP